MRSKIFLLTCFAIATVHAEPRCPLPAATCLPAHGHPVLETKIKQLREESQRRLDKVEAATQALQADVTKQAAQTGTLSRQVDELALRLDQIDGKLAAQRSRWLEILLSGLIASLLATGLSSLILARNRRTDYTVALLDQYQALSDKRAGVEAIFAGSAGANIALPSHQNFLVDVGNWYERLADAYVQKRVDRAALWGLGVVEDAKRFVASVEKLATVHQANPGISGMLREMIVDWKSIDKMKDLPQPSEGWWSRLLGVG